MMSILDIYLSGVIFCGFHFGFWSAYDNYVLQQKYFTRIDYVNVFGNFIVNLIYGFMKGIFWPLFIWYL